ncbi:MAG TPA: ATP-binding protein, partial [Kofleriaceae bacterium]|nr:ATP-binding protein [Kofleriaceae bacterium]
DLETQMFDAPAPAAGHAFELAHAHQGAEAVEMVIRAHAARVPFALAFVDMRMPPGLDGLETIEQMWRIDPKLQVVICSAYTDYSLAQLHERLGRNDSLLIVKKPFDTVEVVQAAYALTQKWNLARRASGRLDRLDGAVRDRTEELVAVNQRLAGEIAERDRVEGELRLAHKLEAVGQLAAGVAHEINTPIQYVGDSLQFLRESTMALVSMATAMQAVAEGSPLAERMRQIVDDADLDYLATEVPSSLDAIQGGVSRIATIVRAMKELSHPGPREAIETDINHALTNALELTANQYKYTADVSLDLGDLPRVRCFPSDLNQVWLNLIVNAAQAMEEQKGKRGNLTVRSFVDDDHDHVVISIADTGPGIAEAIRARIYEAFFTTKPIGRGTGQGLGISRAIVVDRHRGSIWFDSQCGVGTTFYVRLPIAGPRDATRPIGAPC